MKAFIWRCELLSREKLNLTAVLALVAIIGICGVLFATRRGVYISNDSALYIGVARSLMEGGGLTVPYGSPEPRPLVLVPPLFSAALSVVGGLGVGPISAARWLNAFLFGANIMLVGFMLYRCTRKLWLSTLGCVVMLSSSVMFQIHSAAWSEPLYIFFGFLALALVDVYDDNPKLLLIVGAGCAMALCFLTRYTAPPLVAAGLLAIFLLSKQGYLKKLGACCLFGLASILPVVVWMVRTWRVAGTTTNRTLAFHPITPGHFREAAWTVCLWLVPETLMRFVRVRDVLLVFAALLILSAVLIMRGRREDGENDSGLSGGRIPYLFMIIIVSYASFLVVSISFLDALTPLDGRILAPVYVAGLILIISLANRLVRSIHGRRFLKATVMLICIAYAALHVGHWIVSVGNRSHDGLGYSSRAWKESRLVQEVKALPSSVPVYTNNASAMYILTGRAVRAIPSKVNALTLTPNDDYVAQLVVMADHLRERDGILVYLTKHGLGEMPSQQELVETLSLRLIENTADGSIYAISNQ